MFHERVQRSDHLRDRRRLEGPIVVWCTNSRAARLSVLGELIGEFASGCTAASADSSRSGVRRRLLPHQLGSEGPYTEPRDRSAPVR